MESILDNAITNSTRNQELNTNQLFYFLSQFKTQKITHSRDKIFSIMLISLKYHLFWTLYVSFHHPLYKYDYCN